MYFSSWIFRAVPSFWALIPDYKFLYNFLSSYHHGTSFPLTVLPITKRKRDMGLREHYVVCAPELQI